MKNLSPYLFFPRPLQYTMSFKDTVLYKLKVGHERLQKLRKERNRVRNHAAHFVDTGAHPTSIFTHHCRPSQLRLFLT